MRIAIVVVLAVLAVAYTKAQPASGPPSVNQTFTGKSTPTNPTSNGVQSKWAHELTATESGRPDAVVVADSGFKTHKKFKDAPNQPIPAHPDCPGSHPWGAELQKLEWTQTYPDGSSFKGKAETSAVKPVCTDGSEFKIEAKGEIKKNGTGDFADLEGGTWEANITVSRVCDQSNGYCPTEGTFKATFEYK